MDHSHGCYVHVHWVSGQASLIPSLSFHPFTVPRTIWSCECFITVWVNQAHTCIHSVVLLQLHVLSNSIHPVRCASRYLQCREVCVPLNVCVGAAVLLSRMCSAPADWSAVMWPHQQHRAGNECVWAGLLCLHTQPGDKARHLKGPTVWTLFLTANLYEVGLCYKWTDSKSRWLKF